MRNKNILNGCSILLVEDDAIQAVDLFDSLTDAGARAVVSVAQLDHAMKIVKKHEFDGAVIDYRLGESRATPLADYLDSAGTPFVIHTGYAHDQFPRRWRGCRLVSKPAAPEKLILTLAALMRWQRMNADRPEADLHPA